jgi:plastocyanin
MNMKRGLIALAALLAVPALAHGQGTVTEIATGDDFFEPEDVVTDVGVESFRWRWGGDTGSVNEHNVFQDDRLFDSGNLEVEGDFTVTPSAGTFHYYCTAHGFEQGGMDGELAVRPTATQEGKQTLVTWATESTDTGNRYDVRRKTGSKKAKIVEENTKAIEGAFKLKSGTKYTFQVRSRRGKAASGWSPKLKVKG